MIVGSSSHPADPLTGTPHSMHLHAGADLRVACRLADACRLCPTTITTGE